MRAAVRSVGHERAHAPAASELFGAHPLSQYSGGIRMAASPSMFSREGGSPVWVPAFAGKQVWRLPFGTLAFFNQTATPA